MDESLKSSIWQQFGAAIDYLSNTINACPDELWKASLWQTPDSYVEYSEFWYIAYYTLFWLDLYLTGAVEGFIPPAPFTLSELKADAPAPERAFTKAELQSYLKNCRQKCQATIEALSDETVYRRCVFSWGEASFLELLIYNLRHVQGHAAQLDMLLGQKLGPQSHYVTQARREAR